MYHTTRTLVCLLVLALLCQAVSAQNIHEAVTSGNVELVRDIIAADHTQINAITEQGMTPLRLAISARNVEMVKLLLESGAGTDDTHPMYGSVINQAFVISCQQRQGPELVELLLEHGIAFDAGQVDALGMSPLDWAAHFGNPSLARLALAHSADVNLVSTRLGRPALVAAVSQGNEELVDVLLENGADVSIADSDSYPSVYYAASKGRTDILQGLLAHGARTDFVEPHFGRNLIHLAAINGFNDIAAALAAKGSDANATDQLGHVPIYYAAKYGNRDVAEFLIENGAERPPGVTENYGPSPWLGKGENETQLSVWYLNHRGWAAKTENHFLIFDAEEFGVRRSDNPCLANGLLTADELRGQNLLGLYSCYHGRPGDPAYLHALSDSLDNIAFVHLVDDAWRGSPNTTYLEGKSDTVVTDMKVRTIDIAQYMPMLAYMCDIDGMTIYYQAFGTDNLDTLAMDYEFLRQFVDTVDIAFLPVPEPDTDSCDARLFLERFPTRSVVLVDASRREYMYPAAAHRIADWGFSTEIFCAQNPGDHFRVGTTGP